MKKSVAIASLLVLLFACIMAAGCVSFFDPIVGTWKLTEPTEEGTAETGGGTATLSFYANGKGLEKIKIVTEVREGTSYKAGLATTTFDWSKDNAGKYTISFPDSGEIISDAYNPVTGKVTTRWGVYTKQS